MKKCAALLLITLAAGCTPTPIKPPPGPDKDAEKVAAILAPKGPVVTPESINDYNAAQKAQALEAEIRRDQQPLRAVAGR